VGQVDERADVFGMGAILCVILTGKPPYQGPNFRRQAQQAELADAFARLDDCGADTPLVGLARSCLAADPGERSRDAERVAEAVRGYLRSVAERLRQAELERAQAQVRAQEERKRRRLAVVLAGAVLALLMAGAAGGLYWREQVATARERQSRTDEKAREVLELVDRLLANGWRAQDLAKLQQASAEADRVEDIASSGRASGAVVEQIAALRRKCEALSERARKNQGLREALLEVSGSRETSRYKIGESGSMPVVELSADAQFAEAFRRWWDLDVDKMPLGEVVQRIRQEPEVVQQDLMAALDVWMLARRIMRPQRDWRRLHRLAERLDQDTRRQQLRALLVGRLPPRAEDVAGLVAPWPPWPALWQVQAGSRWRRLQELRRGVQPGREPVQTLVLLGQISFELGDKAGAERLLRAGLVTQPGQVVLLEVLGRLVERQGRHAEAVACYRAIRAVHPGLGIALGRALIRAGQAVEGEEVLRELANRQEANPDVYIYLGQALAGQKRPAEAEAALRKAIALKPDFAEAYSVLGVALLYQKKPAEAEAALRKAIALKPDDAVPYNNIGVARLDQKKPAEAEAALRKAIALKPDYALPYNNLGNALLNQMKPAEAVAAYRKAIALKPDYPDAYNNLGNALLDQKKLAEAEAAFRKAIEFAPKSVSAQNGLGLVLMRMGRFAEARESTRGLLTLIPVGNPLRTRVSQRLQVCEQLIALEKRLTVVLKGATEPKDAVERLGLAVLCQLPNQRRYAAAARFYNEAFRSQPKLAENLASGHRYNAACTAALAAAGQGEGAGKLDDKDRARLREQALGWLKADLAAWAKLAEGPAAQRPVVWQQLTGWQNDADLAGVRAKSALEKLSAAERDAWRKLWADVDELLKRVSDKK
jgi:tetratricopeptide (TPR) repeat protein